jgi:hypothetical protein
LQVCNLGLLFGLGFQPFGLPFLGMEAKLSHPLSPVFEAMDALILAYAASISGARPYGTACKSYNLK